MLEMELFEELSALLEKVSTKELDYRGNAMEEVCEHDAVLGTIHNDLVRRMHCVQVSLIALSLETNSRAEGVFDDDEKAQLKSEAARLKTLADVVSALMWYHLRADMGHWGGTVGMRKNWTAVKPGVSGAPPASFLDLLRKLHE
jgi:hypothetical protein